MNGHGMNGTVNGVKGNSRSKFFEEKKGVKTRDTVKESDRIDGHHENSPLSPSLDLSGDCFASFNSPMMGKEEKYKSILADNSEDVSTLSKYGVSRLF